MNITDIYTTELNDIIKDEISATLCDPHFRMLVALTLKSIEEELVSIDLAETDSKIIAQYRELKMQHQVYSEFQYLQEQSKQRVESWRTKL